MISRPPCNFVVPVARSSLCWTGDRDADLHLQEYAISSYRAVAALPNANALDVESLGNWFYNNKPLIQQESAFLSHRDDLFALVPRKVADAFDDYVHRFIKFRYLGDRAENVSCLYLTIVIG